MFGSNQYGVSAYSQIGVETGVLAASPHQLIVMLFEGAIVALNNATQQMRSGDIPAKGKSISKAISIIDNGLRASLDKKVGGDIALNLDALYEYMSRELIFANLNNDEEKINSVVTLLRDLKGAWEAIAPGKIPSPANTNNQQALEA